MRNYDVSIADIQAMPDGPEKTIQWLVCALAEDAGHHKQWFIERALFSLGVDVGEVHKFGIEHDWWGIEPGIAP